MADDQTGQDCHSSIGPTGPTGEIGTKGRGSRVDTLLGALDDFRRAVRVSPDLYRAARVVGFSRWRAFWLAVFSNDG